MIINFPRCDGKLDFRGVFKQRQVLLFLAICLGADAGPSEVVGAENDVLRGNCDRPTRGRRENVIWRKHQLTALHLRFDGKRHVDSHLVTIEVRIVSGADERVHADGRAFDQLRLEGLDRKAVQSRRPVQEDRVAFRHLREDVPDLGGLAIDHLFRGADRVAIAQLFQAANDERLKQSEGHFFRQPALAELEIGADDDD